MPAPGKSLGAICPVAIQNNKPGGLTLCQNSFINKKYRTQSEHRESGISSLVSYIA